MKSAEDRSCSDLAEPSDFLTSSSEFRLWPFFATRRKTPPSCDDAGLADIQAIALKAAISGSIFAEPAGCLEIRILHL
jgi:hypothetical protein